MIKFPTTASSGDHGLKLKYPKGHSPDVGEVSLQKPPFAFSLGIYPQALTCRHAGEVIDVQKNNFTTANSFRLLSESSSTLKGTN
jgi:hypothetical protein